MSVFLQHNLSPCLHLHELKTFFPNDSRGQTLKISDLIARDKKRAYFSCKRKDRRQYRSIENSLYLDATLNWQILLHSSV